MKKYHFAIFDLDGTILNTLADLRNSLNYALTSCHYPERSMDEVRRFVGNGVKQLVARGVPAGTGPAELEQVLAKFHEHYQIHSMDNTCPYEGIPELLRALRSAGVQLAVVSNKVDYAVKDLCSKFYPDLFDAALGETPERAKKPAPDMVNLALNQLHALREQAVYIGDTEVDIETARNAGLDEILVTWGFRDRRDLQERGAKQLAETPEEIYRIITQAGGEGN